MSTPGASTWKQTHAALAQLLASLLTGTEVGVPSTADERKIPPLANTNAKGDVMTLTGGTVPQKPTLSFSQATRLIMDVTLGHVYDTAEHTPKPNGLRDAESRKRAKYVARYQGYAFAPLGKGTPSPHLCATRLVNVVPILSDGSGSSRTVRGDPKPDSTPSRSKRR